MIGALEGKPIVLSDSTIIMTGGVGYRVSVPANFRSMLSTKESVFLFVHTVVKEDDIQLYGFSTEKDLSMFRMLLDVSGVGPKTALAIVDFGVNGIVHAIVQADVSFFTQIPKVGKKVAQKIIIELKNKIGSVAELDLSDTGGETQDIIESLIHMGYSPAESRELVRRIPEDIVLIEEKIRYVLKLRKI